MKILLTNDDGIHAQGLWVLEKHLSRRHDVAVVAPDRERTAVGHGITLNQPLRTVEMTVNGGARGYAVNGTPADCVILGVKEILPAPPDLVISGINPGANLGNNINYSGTVAAAREAALRGIPALSVSVKGLFVRYYEDAAVFISRLVEDIRLERLSLGTFLNVNLPDIPLAEFQGVRVSRLGVALPLEGIEKRVDPRQRAYYWHGPGAQEFDAEPDFDGAAVNGRLVSITPIKCDSTDYDAIDVIRAWGLERGVEPAA